MINIFFQLQLLIITRKTNQESLNTRAVPSSEAVRRTEPSL